MRYSLVEQDLDGPASQGTAPPAPPPRADERRAPPEPPDTRSAETDAVNRGHDPSIKYPRKPRSLPPPSGEPGTSTSLGTSTPRQSICERRCRRATECGTEGSTIPLRYRERTSIRPRCEAGPEFDAHAEQCARWNRSAREPDNGRKSDEMSAERDDRDWHHQTWRCGWPRNASPALAPARLVQPELGTFRPQALSLLYHTRSANLRNYQSGTSISKIFS